MSSKDLHVEVQKVTIADLQRQLSEFEEAFATKTEQFCYLKKRIAELETEVMVLRSHNEHLNEQSTAVRTRAMIAETENGSLKKRVAELEAQSNPELDATDAAHPAWWRGNDAGVKSAALIVLSLLDGQEPKGGTFALPDLNEIRDKIDHMRAELRGAQTYSGLVEGDKFKLFDILRRAKQVLEDADAIVPPKKQP